jgi:SnoaL-like protein
MRPTKLSENVKDARTLESRLREVADKQEIRDVLMRWCRGLDRGDVLLMSSCYHPDATDEHGRYKYSGTTAAQSYIERHKRDFKRHLHTTLNDQIEIEGDIAHCESYAIAYLVLEAHMLPPGRDRATMRITGGRYLDRLERRGGIWRFARRFFIVDWTTNVDITEPQPPEHPPGLRTQDDRSYEYLSYPNLRKARD